MGWLCLSFGTPASDASLENLTAQVSRSILKKGREWELLHAGRAILGIHYVSKE
jgi:hypothetical protein